MRIYKSKENKKKKYMVIITVSMSNGNPVQPMTSLSPAAVQEEWWVEGGAAGGYMLEFPGTTR